MTHDELLKLILDSEIRSNEVGQGGWQALRAVMELHKPQEITLPDGSWGTNCKLCDGWSYPCLTIDTIRHAF